MKNTILFLTFITICFMSCNPNTISISTINSTVLDSTKLDSISITAMDSTVAEIGSLKSQD